VAKEKDSSKVKNHASRGHEFAEKRLGAARGEKPKGKRPVKKKTETFTL